MDVWALQSLSPEPHQPHVLRSDDGVARVIALTLPAGERLQEHQVHEHAWLVLLDGQLEVADADGGQATLDASSLAYFAPTERHEVRATSTARLLLFLAPWPGPGHPNLRAV
jgi:quercetin dioxygenase-like cupin family protein